jgi:hypothetical protein
MRSSRSAAVILGMLLVTGAALSAPSVSASPAGPTNPAQPDNPSSVSVQPGEVSTQDTSCNAGDLCFWVDTDQRGAKGRVSGTNPAWGVFPQSQCASGTWDNCASSIINNGRNCTARVFYDGNYQGRPYLDVLRGNGYINLDDHYISWPLRTWNDEISSNSWVNCS